jgi:ABC-type transport system substrate-binding protein
MVSYLPSFSYGIDVGVSIAGSISQSAMFYPSTTVYIPDDYQAKFDQANAEVDSQKRQEMFKDLMKVITDEYCIGIPIFLRTSLAALSPNVHDMNINILAASNYNPENAWMSK